MVNLNFFNQIDSSINWAYIAKTQQNSANIKT